MGLLLFLFIPATSAKLYFQMLYITKWHRLLGEKVKSVQYEKKTYHVILVIGGSFLALVFVTNISVLESAKR